MEFPGEFNYPNGMIFCPLPGTPLITQGFGQNPDIYDAFELAGHNGIDFDVPKGTTVYAPHDGLAATGDELDDGYGKYVRITTENRQSILAHLSAIDVTDGQFVYQGDPIGRSGDSGFGTGPHLHWTYKILKDGVVQNQNNGYQGAVDVTEFTRLWLDKDLHYDATYTDFASEYLAMNFPKNVYLNNPSRIA